MPVSPAFDGDSWDCAYGEMEARGYSVAVDDIGQLSVSATTGNYLFSVYPDVEGLMRMYSYSLHAPPSCAGAEQAYGGMKVLLNVLEQNCGYTADSVSVEFECSSNKALHPTSR